MSALTRITEKEQERKMKTSGRISLEENMKVLYSKNPHKRTRGLGVQADFVLLCRVFSAKSA